MPECDSAAVDPHLLFVAPDGDGDGLVDAAEGCCPGAKPDDPDCDRNGVQDGADLARALLSWISELPGPGDAVVGSPYAYEHDFHGREYCRVCGAEFQRGVLTVANPASEQEVSLPYLALHFLEHGSLSYCGSSHHGQVEPCALLAALYDCHVVGVGNDRDGDFLSDGEENALGLDAGDPDEDRSWRPDGMEIGRTLGAIFHQIPVGEGGGGLYRIFREPGPPSWIRCPVCGQRLRVGVWSIFNPERACSLDLDNLACHFLERGSLGGGAVGFRTDLEALLDVLDLRSSITCCGSGFGLTRGTPARSTRDAQPCD